MYIVHDWIRAHYPRPPGPSSDEATVARLAEEMRAHGWIGPPIVVDWAPYSRPVALTGRNRIPSALTAGIKVPVVNREDLFRILLGRGESADDIRRKYEGAFRSRYARPKPPSFIYGPPGGVHQAHPDGFYEEEIGLEMGNVAEARDILGRIPGSYVEEEPENVRGRRRRAKLMLPLPKVAPRTGVDNLGSIEYEWEGGVRIRARGGDPYQLPAIWLCSPRDRIH